MSPGSDIPERPMMGSCMSAKRFMEIKSLLRDAEPRGLQSLETYNKEDIAATEEIFTEVISPRAFDQISSDPVPLTMYVNGERREIGTARITDNMVMGRIDKIEADELRDVMTKNTLNGVSFGFHLNSFRGDYPGAVDIPLVQENKKSE